MERKFNKILVTGGAGYVGSVLIQKLLSDGYDVRVFDNLGFGSDSVIQYFGDTGFEFIKGDIRDKKAVADAVSGMDVVIHLAGIVGFPACRKNPQLSREVNVEGTRRVVEATAGKIPILFASTGSTFGKMLEKICYETTPLNPVSDYGRQKADAEEIVKGNKEFVIYRFATAFGVSPRMRLDLMVNDFVFRAVQERNLIVYEKNFMRTFIHVRDMARAFMFALENYDRMRGEIYNVGDNDMNYSKEQICDLIKSKIDFYLHFADFDHDLDQRDYVVSYDKIRDVGFRAEIGMEQGIDELLNAVAIIEVRNPYNNV